MLLPRSLRALAGAFLLLVPLAACGGGDEPNPDATPEDVDQSTPVAITEEEAARFRAPADSVVTPAQVDAYLKTSLLQFDLMRKESARLHERVKGMEEREKEGGTLGQLQNMVAAGQTVVQVGDLLGGSYIRSARTLGHNPAEMEWVRQRMGEVAGYVMMKPMYEAAARSAQDMRTQADQLQQQLAAGGAAGFTEADIQQMRTAADQMTAGGGEQGPSRAVLANVEVLRRAKPAVTESMWSAVGFAGGSSGILALSGLSDPNDKEAQKKLDEFRQVFTDALENRVSPGMENKPAAQP